MTYQRWEPAACLLCGHEEGASGEVRMGMVRWAEADSERRFSALPRCTDRAACRTRVEGAGGVWEVVDAESRDERGIATGFTDAHRRAIEAGRAWMAAQPMGGSEPQGADVADGSPAPVPAAAVASVEEIFG